MFSYVFFCSLWLIVHGVLAGVVLAGVVFAGVVLAGVVLATPCGAMVVLLVLPIEKHKKTIGF